MTFITQNIQAIGLLVVALVGQIMGASAIPKTDLFRNVKWTAFMFGSFTIALWMISILITRGMALSIVIPLLSGLVPLSVSLVAIFVEGEPATPGKLILLTLACLLIGGAGMFG